MAHTVEITEQDLQAEHQPGTHFRAGEAEGIRQRGQGRGKKGKKDRIMQNVHAMLSRR